jgi:hypothetical protein
MVDFVNIYVLKDPITNEPRYVGKTIKSLEIRKRGHLKERVKKRNTYKYNWIKKLKDNKLEPIIELIDAYPISEWQYWEKHWIEEYRNRGFNLTNLAIGGIGSTGVKHTEESKRKLSLARTGKKHSDETKIKMKKNHRDTSGLNNPMFGKQSAFKGKKHTEESKQKISKACSKKYIKHE